MAFAATAGATARATANAMAGATAGATAATTPPAARPPRRLKRLWWLLAALLLLALAGAGATAVVVKKRAAALAESDDATDAIDTAAVALQARRSERKSPPLYVPLEPFVVNLADRDVDRFAQIGVTLQVEDARVADELKLYLPAVRSGILMVLAHKTSKQLLDRQGKEQLVAEIMREAVRPMGIHIDVPELDEPTNGVTTGPTSGPASKPAPLLTNAAASATAAAAVTPIASASAAPMKPVRARQPAEHNPVVAVNFSSFIIQ